MSQRSGGSQKPGGQGSRGSHSSREPSLRKDFAQFMFTCGLTFFVVAVIGAVTSDMKLLGWAAGLTVLFGAVTAWVAPTRQSASGSQRPCDGCGNEHGFHEEYCARYRWR